MCGTSSGAKNIVDYFQVFQLLGFFTSFGKSDIIDNA